MFETNISQFKLQVVWIHISGTKKTG